MSDRKYDMWSPDDLDIRIIKAMASPHSFQWDVRISNANVAKGLSVDEETVRNRLRRMEDVGFLNGWQLILNPILIGKRAAIIELNTKEKGSKDEVISRLKLLEGVTLIEDFYGSELAVQVLYENEGSLTRQVKLIAYLCGSSKPIWWKLGFPPCELTPTKTEWRIIRSIRKDARGRLSDIAKSLKLSTRTVKRHMMHLSDGNAFYLDPLLDVKKVGGLRARFWVVCDADKKRSFDAEAISKLSRIISTHTATKGYSLIVVHCANAFEVQDISQWLKEREGVLEVRSNIDVEHIHVDEWLAGELDRKLLAQVL